MLASMTDALRLNARKPIREEQEARAQRTIEVPTIPTIL